MAESSVVHDAAEKGDLKALQNELSRNPQSVHRQNKHAQTALIVASANGHHAAVALLLDSGAEIDHADQWGATALIWSTAKGRHETIKVLVIRKADVSRKTVTALATLWDRDNSAHDIASAKKDEVAIGLLQTATLSISTDGKSHEEEDGIHFHEDDEDGEASSIATPIPSSNSNEDVKTDSVHSAVWGQWGPADWKQLKVRGPTYLDDKVKVSASPYAFKLVHADVLHSSAQIPNIASHPNSYVRKLHAHPTWGADSVPPFHFVINFMIPGTPHYNMTVYWQAPPCYSGLAKSVSSSADGKSPGSASSNSSLSTSSSGSPGSASSNGTGSRSRSGSAHQLHHQDTERDLPTPFRRLLDAFVSGDNDYRKGRFKFIPRVVEAPWVVRKGVGTQPAILGNKLTQTYHTDAKLNYLEVDVDVASTKIGSALWKLVKGYATGVSMDFSFLFEGQSSDELPEYLLGGVCIMHVDVSKTPSWEPHSSSPTASS